MYFKIKPAKREKSRARTNAIAFSLSFKMFGFYLRAARSPCRIDGRDADGREGRKRKEERRLYVRRRVGRRGKERKDRAERARWIEYRWVRWKLRKDGPMFHTQSPATLQRALLDISSRNPPPFSLSLSLVLAFLFYRFYVTSSFREVRLSLLPLSFLLPAAAAALHCTSGSKRIIFRGSNFRSLALDPPKKLPRLGSQIYK